ncbi:conjugal transfer TraD family protein [Orientia tsutsugamushi str. UT76]|nr:conjugal transfer TraD family protein [Orientia tsutsugamushi str. UT76]
MANLMQQKITLQQKKARLIMDEVNLKIKERKMRTRRLIEMGGLLAKAELDHLPTNTLLVQLFH